MKSNLELIFVDLVEKHKGYTWFYTGPSLKIGWQSSHNQNQILVDLKYLF